MKENRRRDPGIHNLGTRQRWVASFYNSAVFYQKNISLSGWVIPEFVWTLWSKYIFLSLRGIDSRSSGSHQVTLLSDQLDHYIYKHTRAHKVAHASSETKIFDVEQEKYIPSNSMILRVMCKVKQLNRHVILFVKLQTTHPVTQPKDTK